MKIAWINEHASLAGGAERYVTETARHLGKQGVRSWLLYGVGSRVEPTAVAPFEGAFPVVDVRQQIEALDPDLVYVHQIEDDAVVAAALASGRPVVRFLHDHRLLCLREHKYTAIGRKTCEAAPGLGCYACLGFVRREPRRRSLQVVTLGDLRARLRLHDQLAGIVVGSRYMRDQAVLAGLSRGRVHVAQLYADEVATVGGPRAQKTLLFVGAMTTGKGVDVLLDAVARVPEARLGLVGDGPQRAELEAQARRLGLASRVSFTGRLAPEEVADLHARATCLVMPARQPESFGLVGVEAMSHGTPIIAARAGGVTEWLAHGKNGLLVPPGDVSALAGAIKKIVDDEEAAAAMGEAGRAIHRQRFLPGHHVRRLTQILAPLATRRAA